MPLQTAVLVEGYRAVLEDRAAVIPFDDGLVVAVADGAGGRPGGARAAEAVIAGIRVAPGSAGQLLMPADWCRILRDMDRAIQQDPQAGETTAVAAFLVPTWVGGASVGDSGAWLITAEGHHDLSGRQQRKPFLGTGAAVPVPFSAKVPAGATLLLATDGLWKYTGSERICEAARTTDLEAAARCLVDLVRLHSGKLQDDVAVVLCRSLPGT
jgi:serine/threonine protein phosphatase PrpC